MGGNIKLDGEQRKESVVFINLAKKDIKAKKTKVDVGIYSQGKMIDKTTVTFIAP
jgi:hypothetical protein